MSWHVFRVGWVHEPDPLLGVRVHSPDPVRVYEDPAAARVRVAEVLRKRAEAANPPRQPWPTPEVMAREVAAAALPEGPARLLSRLQALGWSAAVTYARGTLPDAQGRPGRVADSYVLRGKRGNRRCAAIWEGTNAGKVTTKGVLTLDERGLTKMKITEFEEGL